MNGEYALVLRSHSRLLGFVRFLNMYQRHPRCDSARLYAALGCGLVIATALASGCASGGSRDVPDSPTLLSATSSTPSAVVSWTIPQLRPPLPITVDEYAARRRRLVQGLQDGVFLLLGAPPPSASYISFRQAPDFRYLTGLGEPDAALVMMKDGASADETLFVQPRDPAREVWENRRLGTDAAHALTGISARPLAELIPVLDSLLAIHDLLSMAAAPSLDLAAGAARQDQNVVDLLKSHPGVRVKPIRYELLWPLRYRKEPPELDRIRRAAYITAYAVREAMQGTYSGTNEFEIRALVEYAFLRSGAEGPAFGSIVASGSNATTLHFIDGDRFMQDGELLLVDVGASYDGYAADVTRTFPVNGQFSSRQRTVYSIVLDAQKAAESMIREGVTWLELHEAAEGIIEEGLARLGLIEAPGATYDCDSNTAGKCSQHRLFFMHALGHGVGLHVHDPDISAISFRPGSAVAIEPGIYVRDDVLDRMPNTPRNRAIAKSLRHAVECYRNIGIRIEDTYVFSDDGVERVSAGVPREIVEIEALMSKSSPQTGTRQPHVVNWYRSRRPLDSNQPESAGACGSSAGAGPRY